MTDRAHPAIPWIFALSGAAGLIHQVAWTRMLRRVLGSGTLALTAVLCVFLGGLALGSWLATRPAARRRGSPLRLFAGLELAIAVYTASLPWWVPRLGPVWTALYRVFEGGAAEPVARFALAGLVLLPASLLMGATLPVLVRPGDGEAGSGRLAGTLYAFNSAGAVVGALSAGFVLLPAVGLRGTVLVAATLNLGAAGLTLLVSRLRGELADGGPPDTAERNAPRGERVRSGGRWVLVLYGVAGGAALIDEIAWTRALALALGSTAYAFSVIVATFILGLSIGGGIAARWGDGWGRDVDRCRAALAASLAVAGCGALAAIPPLGTLPLRMTGIMAAEGARFLRLSAIELGVVASLLLLPTIGMGAAFPLAVRATGWRPPSRAAGLVYAGNTLGTIVGALAAAFVLLPAIGLRGTLLMGAATHLIVAAALLGVPWTGRASPLRSLSAAALVLVGLGASAWIPSWDPATSSFGPFVHARRLPAGDARDAERLERLAGGVDVVFHEDGRDATVTVKRAPDGELSLWVNGKPDASSRADLPTQQLLADLPLLLHPEPRAVLVVGLASGITAAAVARHPVERIEIVEIAPAIVRASRLFDDVNGGVLDDPRVELVVDDARHHLLVSDARYDVIVSEPSNPWIAGVGDLFTREFFELARGRLREGGSMCVWLEGNDLDRRSFRSVVRAFLDVFPTTRLWHATASDFLLIGSTDERRVDAARLVEAIGREPTAGHLRRIGIGGPVDLLGRLVLDVDGVERFADDAPAHTDDDARLEFAAPRLMIRNPDELALILDLQALRRSEFGWLVGAPAGPGSLEALQASASRRVLASGRVERANARFAEGRQREAIEELAAAARIDPDDPGLKRNVDRNLRHVRDLRAAGRLEEARAYARMLYEINPRDPDVASAFAALEAGSERPGQR